MSGQRTHHFPLYIPSNINNYSTQGVGEVKPARIRLNDTGEDCLIACEAFRHGLWEMSIDD